MTNVTLRSSLGGERIAPRRSPGRPESSASPPPHRECGGCLIGRAAPAVQPGNQVLEVGCGTGDETTESQIPTTARNLACNPFTASTE